MEDHLERALKSVIEKEISNKIQDEIDAKVRTFREDLMSRKDNYIAEVMKGIRVYHEKDAAMYGINYRIIFDNIYTMK